MTQGIFVFISCGGRYLSVDEVYLNQSTFSVLLSFTDKVSVFYENH